MKTDSPPASESTLLIHLGGLGDVCLSESTFYSVSQHCGGNVLALGYPRFLGLFGRYFVGIESIENRQWLWLFSDFPSRGLWKQTVLIGKDQHGDLRRKLASASEKSPIFINMYPEDERSHIEEYQLLQISAHGIPALRKEVAPAPAERVILYPEESRGKRKWPYEHFLALAEMLRAEGIDTVLLEAPDVARPALGSLRFDKLNEVATFFGGGGVFFSNDSGVAHLAGVCGLRTITLFCGQNPAVWRPRGQNVSIVCDEQGPRVTDMVGLIVKAVTSGLQ
jgi:hypothetical protein